MSSAPEQVGLAGVISPRCVRRARAPETLADYELFLEADFRPTSRLVLEQLAQRLDQLHPHALGAGRRRCDGS